MRNLFLSKHVITILFQNDIKTERAIKFSSYILNLDSDNFSKGKTVFCKTPYRVTSFKLYLHVKQFAIYVLGKVFLPIFR